MKVLVLGATGMLGHTVINHFSKNFEVAGTVRNSSSYPELNNIILFDNISPFDINGVEKLIKEFKPNFVINCIGIIKQLDEANNSEISIVVNSLFPHQLARICESNNARVIHFSTDCIFSGKKNTPYLEEDFPDCYDLYGRTKFLGELNYSNTLTIRTSIIGRELRGGKSLIEWAFSQKGNKIKGFTKALYTGFTTKEMSKIIENIINNFSDMYGVWHVSSDSISKYDLLCKLNEIFKLDMEIEKDENFTCDRRLDSTKFRTHIGYTPPNWTDMLKEL